MKNTCAWFGFPIDETLCNVGGVVSLVTVNAALATALEFMPALKALARTVALLVKVKDPLYTGDVSVGVVPLIV